MTRTMTSAVTGMPLPAPFLDAYRDAVERLGDGPLAPGLDLYTTPETIVASVALPGVKPQDVDIDVADDLVTISGSVTDEARAGDYVYRELGWGSFKRSFRLPSAVSPTDARASLEDGLLTLTLPKTDHSTPKHVKVGVA
jgi:HSP20 family protein